VAAYTFQMRGGVGLDWAKTAKKVSNGRPAVLLSDQQCSVPTLDL